METRSRKRGEASTSSAISGPITRSNKRSRSTASAAVPANDSIIVTRARTRAATQSASMDKNSEHSGSTQRDRRGKDPSSKQRLDMDNSNNEKGKEKEPEIQHRESERVSALSIGSRDGGEDDNYSETGGGIFHQNLTSSASIALQGLLRKLGAGLDDLIPSSATGYASSSLQSGTLKSVLSGLRADGEEGRQVEALLQLCDILSIGTEDSLSTFSVDSFVPALVGLLNHESNPDIMLFAARALTHLVDVLPSSCAAVVHYGALSCFVARLLTIEYIDLAEQSLQALKTISQEHPTACLQAGALMAVLFYLDFFSTGVQRVALATAANMCKKLPSNAADYVMPAVPILSNLLQYQDAKVLESASICLTQIAEAFASSPEKLDELCNYGLVTQAASLITSSNSVGGQSSLSTSTYTGLIRLLSTCASGSSLGAKSLLLLGISGILRDILSGSDLVSNMSVSPALSRPPEQIFEIVNLANELLPPLPQRIISLPETSGFHMKSTSSRKVQNGSSNKQEISNDNLQEGLTRVKMLTDQPELLQKFGVDLLPVMIQIYGSSVNSSVRHKCLSVIGKIMYFAPSGTMQSIIGVTNISSFLARVFASKDPQVIGPALQTAVILMERHPDTFSKMFVREGVVHAVDALIKTGSSGTNQQSLGEKDNESFSGSSPTTRKSRRRGAAYSSDAGHAENSKSSNPSTDSKLNPVEILASSYGLQAKVGACAQAFKKKYFPVDPKATESGGSDDLIRLKNLSMKLISRVDEQKAKSKGKSKAFPPRHFDVSSREEENFVEVIIEILKELSSEEGVSTFEFINSGVVESLLNYLTCSYFSKERIAKDKLPEHRRQAMRRYQSFLSIFLPSTVVENNAVVPMSILVQKLQSALSSLERFPVLLSHAPRSSGGNGGLPSGLSALSHPFKLCLCRAPGEKSLRDYSSNIVLIDPLASLAAVEDFLWPRVQRTDSIQKLSASRDFEPLMTPGGTSVSSPPASAPVGDTRRRSARLSSIGANAKDQTSEKKLSSSKGKGKAVLMPSLEESRNIQTRNTTQRKVLDKENDLKGEEGDTSSEDDELDMSPAEIDETLVFEEDVDLSGYDEEEAYEDGEEHDEGDTDEILGDDALPVSAGDKVHDVKFADSADATSGQSNATRSSSGRVPAELQSGSPFASKGAMSFAAAAMAGLTSANNGGLRGGKDLKGRPLIVSYDSPRLVFTAGGRQLNRHLNVYQAIQCQRLLGEDEDNKSMDLVSSDGNRLGDIYTIMYQRVDAQAEMPLSGNVSSTSLKITKGSTPNLVSDKSSSHLSLLDSIFQGELPCDLERSNPIYNILALLRVLEALNQLAPLLRVEHEVDKYAKGKVFKLDSLAVAGARVPQENFVNGKLTPKLARQIQEPLALCSGSLPSWCNQLTKACPFLFPFETRRQFFYSTAFGVGRALNWLLQQQGADGHRSTSERRFGRLQRQKVRLSRNRILDSAIKVMEMYSSQKAVLEVEYFGEVGTGLGPTLEFYTLLSQELQKAGLCMWRLSSSIVTPSGVDKDIIHAPLGLFPRPWPPNADSSAGTKFSKVLEYYRLLGGVMAKALQDGRLLDLPLSTAFYKLILGQELDLHDISSFDVELGTSLQEMQAIVLRKEYLDSCGGFNPEELTFHGASIEDLCLDFSLPGYPDYVLKPGSENVDLNSLGDYVVRVVIATIATGISRQMEAFKSGFNQVFDISSLRVFSPSELDYLLCGRRELWKADALADQIKFDHGYTSRSPPITNLLEIMGEFTPEQQRSFCQFVTGAPRLPPGGLAMLNPKLTIVRKHSSTSPSDSADDDLPSVMTCANYLKLPPYSTKEIMHRKLLYAISEGQGSFDLS